MSLLILFQNGRRLVLRLNLTLAVHFIGSVNELDVLAGGDNQLHFIGSVNELDVL